MKKTKLLSVFLCIAFACTLTITGCSSQSYSKTSSYKNSSSLSKSSYYSSKSQSSSYSDNKSSSFTNAYGTPTTKCAHPGCTNYIASSGDTNCCTVHSNKCIECHKYIDEDALYCISCITKAVDKVKKDKYGY